MKKSILGITTLALAGVLSFTGCNKKEEANIEGTWVGYSLKDDSHEAVCGTTNNSELNVVGFNEFCSEEYVFSDGVISIIYNGNVTKKVYRLKGNDIYTVEEDNTGEKWEKTATYEDGKIFIHLDDGNNGAMVLKRK